MQDADRFFKAIHSGLNVRESDYNQVQGCLSTVDAMARTTNQSLYLIDYYRRNFLYVSPNPLFLCEYTTEQVRQMGYGFYSLVVPEEEMKMLAEINDAGFGFFYRQPVGSRLDLTIEYDFHLRNANGHSLLVHHKLTPVLLTDTGDIWLALCVVSVSPRSEVGNVVITQKESPVYYKYSFLSKKWKEHPNIELTERETDILRLSVKGFSNAKIAEHLFIDVNTVKFHKKKIFQKLQTENITEAIGIAADLRLI